jgi:mannose-6-phosphate isomerase
MNAIRLSTIWVEKPWGRHQLWPDFADVEVASPPVGEIWFDAPAGETPELLVKYLFTSERLSIQVHPDDVQAKAAGYPSGKDEAWVVLAAEPGAVIGIGLIAPMSQADLRAAALDGRIEQMVDWKPVHAGDVVYSPAGTVHAIGAGITLIEVQQNVDLTYRLYDYGRPRELHLDAGVAVANPAPFEWRDVSERAGEGRTILARGGKFVLERWSWAGARAISLPRGVTAWFVPVSGAGSIDGAAWQAGECWMIKVEAQITIEGGADVLFAYPLADPIDMFD